MSAAERRGLDSFDVPPVVPLTCTSGVWVAFNWDGSAFVPFATEIEALRHALSYSMQVRFVEFGDDEWMRK